MVGATPRHERRSSMIRLVSSAPRLLVLLGAPSLAVAQAPPVIGTVLPYTWTWWNKP
jgi:hypothetical protein